MGYYKLMQNWKLHLFLCLFSTVLVYHVLPILIYFIFLVLVSLGGVALAVVYHPGPYERRNKNSFPSPVLPAVEVPLSRIKPYPPPTLKPKLLSPRIDACLREVVDFTIKYHVIPTYQIVGLDQESFFRSVDPVIWKVLLNLLQRIGQVDTLKVVSQDIVQVLRSHFKNYKGIHYCDQVPQNKFPNLVKFPYLERPEYELHFLRQVCEVLMCVGIPREMLECTAVRALMREYLACRILKPIINMVCDPDYINLKMLSHLTKREEAMESGKRQKSMMYKYKDFEDFMNQIKKCEDVEELQTLRQEIIKDIIHAKAIYKMKHSHTTGLQVNQFPIPIPAEKVKVLMGRDLELYIRQLGTAKTSCDRQLRKQGGEECEDEATPIIGNTYESEKPLGIPFATIVINEVTRTYLLRFLEDCGSSHLLSFWVAADSVKKDTSVPLRSSLKKLYDDYLNPVCPDVVCVEQEWLKPIEEFITGETMDAEACLLHVARIQQWVYVELDEQFYWNFIWSEQYRELMQHGGVDGTFNPLDNISMSSLDESHHKKKLKSLKMKLEGKENELSLMPEQVQSHSLTQRKRALQKGRSLLSEEIQKLEHYIDHTEEWFDTVGQWSVEVHSVDLSKDDHNDRNPLFILVVHRPETVKGRRYSDSDTAMFDSMASMHDPSQSLGRSGWALGRHLSEFEKLHEKVVEICPNLQFPPLPKKFNPFQRPDAKSTYWRKYRNALQVYLGIVLQDDRLKECEEVFNFISHASDNLRTKPSAHPEKKNRFSLPVIPGMQLFSHTSKESQPDDTTAEYMYLLFSEIFELDHFSRVLRKQLVELVQLTYGKSIDREVQDTMNWVFSEPMLIFYLETFRDAMWPAGKPPPPAALRSDEEKARTKEEAKAKFLKCSPQNLQTILGQRNCQIGMRKIFELLQDFSGNKQLLYALLEVLLYALVPELQKIEIDDGDE